MNLDVITEGLDIDVGGFVKLAPRKSASQPHTWLVGAAGARCVVKFAAGSPGAADLVRNETTFYRAAGTTPGAEEVAAAVPKLVRAGELEAGPYLVIEYCTGLGSQRWIVRAMHRGRFRRVLDWQAGVLDWLGKMQACEPLRAALGIPAGQVLCHNDLNHFNIIGERGVLKVIDWENWSAGPSRFMDALHVLASPAFAAGERGGGAEEFLAQWQSDTPYRRGALQLLAPFLDDRGWRGCMAEYLEFQRAQIADKAPQIAGKFEQAAKDWTRT